MPPLPRYRLVWASLAFGLLIPSLPLWAQGVITTPSDLTSWTATAPGYSAQITATPAGATFSVSDGGLPPGLGMSGTGLISGTPGSSGIFGFIIRAQFTDGTSAQKDFRITIYPAPVILTSALPDGAQGVAYSQTLAVSGGKSPFSWTVSAGSLPSGMSLSGSGTVGGTPTVSGSFNFTARVTDSAGASATKSFSLLIKPPVPPLSITTSSLPDGTQGTAYSQAVGATGGTPGYTWSLIGGAFPSGVSISAAGLISGTPAASGSFSITVQVADSTGATASKGLSLLIKPPPLSITTSSLPDGAQGTAYSQSVGATGGTPGYTWSLTGGAFPSGVSISAAGLISGTPAASGSFSITVQVADSAGATASKGLSLLIKPPPLSITTSSLPDGTQGSPYSQSVGATGGTPGYTWSLIGGAFPSGLSISAAGLISGTPTASGSFSITVQVADSTGATASKGLSLLVNSAAPPPLSISTTSLPDATKGSAYSQSVGATGGTPGYTWSLIGGAFPSGLSISAAGLISGTPTASGSFSITVQVADSTGATATKTFSLLVNSTAPALSITTSSLPDATKGSAYSLSLTATGGSPEYSWSLASGALPAGIALSPSGLLSGTPTAAGLSSFTVQVTDSAGASVTRGLSLQVKTSPAALGISTLSLADGLRGVAYSVTFAAGGGAPAYTWSLAGGALPAGLSLSPSGILSGVPSGQGTSNFTVRVTDSSGAASTRSFSLRIKAGQGSLTITPPSLDDGIRGNAYGATFSAAGGIPAYVWTLAAGSLPAGLVFTPSGMLTGTPSATGTFNFTVQVSDSDGATAAASFSLVIKASPASLTVSTVSLADGIRSAAYNAALAAGGGTPAYIWTLAGGALPSGLSLSATGVLSGTPSVAGKFSFTAQVSDSAGASATRSLSILVRASPGPLSVATPALPDAVMGTPYSQALAAGGGVPDYSWSLAGGAPPDGLSLSPAGILTGTPSAAGTFNFAVQVADASGAAASRSFSLLVKAAAGSLTVTTTSLPAGLQGSAYSQSVGAAGGAPPYVFSLIGGSQPAGLSLTPATGAIGGTPSESGTFVLTIQVSDSASATASRTVSLYIAPAPGSLHIDSPATLPGASIGRPFSYQLSASGGQTPYVWSLVSGYLPAGLALSSSGNIAGTPTESGEFQFTARVTDSSSGPGPRQATLGFRLTVTSAALSILTDSTLPDAQVAGYYQRSFSAAGGKLPYVWAITSGALPAGLGFNPDTGTISGTPGLPGTYTFSLKLTDALGAADSRAMTLTVRPAADLILSDYALSFTGFSGGGKPAPLTNSVVSSKFQLIPYAVRTDPAAPWLTVSQSGGTTPGRFDIRADQSALAPGSYSATLQVLSDQTAQAIPVSVRFDVRSQPPVIQVSPPMISVPVTGTAQSASSPILLRNTGGSGPVTFSAGVTLGSAWLSVTPTSGTVTGDVESVVEAVIDRRGLSPGFNRGVITISYDGRAVEIPVVANLATQDTPFWLNPSGVVFLAREGNGASGGMKSFSIHDIGSAAYTVENLDGVPWLAITRGPDPLPGEPSVVYLAAEAHNLRTGVYYGRVRVRVGGFPNSPQDLLVILQVVDASVPPLPEPIPAGLVFIGASGSTVPAKRTTLYTSSDQAIGYQAATWTLDGASWLSVSPSTGLTSTIRPAALSVSADYSSLKPGIYRGAAHLSLSNSEVRSVNITAVVTQRPAGLSAASDGTRDLAGCTPASLAATHTGLAGNFSSPAGWPASLAVRVVDNCGDPVTSASVVARFSNGDPSLPLRLTDPKEGTYSGTWTPSKSTAQVTVSANVTAPGFPAVQAELIGKVPSNRTPALVKNGVLNNLNPVLGAPLAPGTVVQIFGTDLAAGDSVAGLPLPTTLNGTSVIVKGVPAPLFFVSNTQINAQLPVELDPFNSEQQILVTVNGAMTVPDAFRLTSVQPGVATFGDGRLIAQHPDYTLISPDSPGHPGEAIVIYLAGMGLTDGNVRSGELSPLSPLARTLTQPTVTVDGKPAEIFFAGLTPGFVGLYQINMRIPAGLAANDKAELIVTQAGVQANIAVLPIAP